MVNFYSNYINCTDPDEATVEQVAGWFPPLYTVMIDVANFYTC